MSARTWIIGADYERSPKDMEYPVALLKKLSSRQESMHELRLTTYAKELLHERYMSSEEEPSPSPDSETASLASNDEQELESEAEVEVEQKQPAMADSGKTDTFDVKTEEPIEFLDYSAEVAIAVPIMAMGRPKLVDIVSLAPMHKRKRSLEKEPLVRIPLKSPPSVLHIPATADDDLPELTHEESDHSRESTEERVMVKPGSYINTAAPDSWLPDDSDVSTTADDSDDEHYFPELDVRPPLTYNDYDPYSLNPPKLSPRTDSLDRVPTRSSSTTSLTKPGSIARARKNVNASNNMLRRANVRINSNSFREGSGVTTTTTTQGTWKGLTRGLSISKKSDHTSTMTGREAKKPKMQARGARERFEMPSIPPFPFQDE